MFLINNGSGEIKQVVTSVILLLLLVTISAVSAQLRQDLQATNQHGDNDAMDVVGKSPAELIELRGFKSQVHQVITEDGYILQVVRIVNPLADLRKLKRPVLFNHGLIESATIWLINSHGVKPRRYPSMDTNINEYSNASLINAPMMLSNEGYDVWLMSLRGTDFSMEHTNKSMPDSEYWNYSLDDFAQRDIPATLAYIRGLTGASKIGYVGHSQATFSIFGLLAIRPEYADLVEPVAAFAPVTFIHHTTSSARVGFLLAANLPLDFINIPYPLFSPQIRAGFKNVCDKAKVGLLKNLCLAEEELISGWGQNFKQGFYSQMPFFSSLKVFRHFGQLIKSKRYCMFDYGKKGNMLHYNSPINPDYPIPRIRSRSISLFWTAYDTLATPTDVKAFVKRLRVPIFRSVFSDDRVNHVDLIVSDKAHEFNRPLLEVFEHFENAIVMPSHDDLRQQQLQLQHDLLFESEPQKLLVQQILLDKQLHQIQQLQQLQPQRQQLLELDSPGPDDFETNQIIDEDLEVEGEGPMPDVRRVNWYGPGLSINAKMSRSVGDGY